MTVIVYRDGIMAADTATFMGHLIVAFDTRKIRRTPDGTLVACSGDVPEVEAFHAWAADGFRPREQPRYFPGGALVVDTNGVRHYKRGHEKSGEHAGRGAWSVEGCHEEFLVGALAAGATAEEAIRLAIRHCTWAGGDVQVERL